MPDGLGTVGTIRVILDGDVRQFRKNMSLMKAQVTAQTAIIKKNFNSIERSLKRVALVGGVAAVGIIKMAADFDKGVREISTLVGGLTDKELAGMKDELKDLAAASGQALNKLTKARYDIVSAGFTDAADAAILLEQSTLLAVAAVSDVATTADVITTAINAYGLEAADAAMISDVLFTTVREGKTTMDLLGGSLGRGIPIAAELGVSLQELTAATATLTAQGQSTDEAITALRAGMVQILKPSKELEVLFKKMGFESGRAAIAALGFGGTLDAVKEAADKNKIPMTDLFNNVRAMQAVFPLVGKASDSYKRKLDAITDSSGNAAQAFDIIAESASFKLATAFQTLRNIGVTIGDSVLPTINEQLDALSAALERNQPRIDAFVSKTAEFINYVIAHADIIGQIFVVATIGKVTVGLYGLAKAIRGIAIASKILLMNPIGAVVTGLVIAVGVTWKLANAAKAAREELIKFGETIADIGGDVDASKIRLNALRNEFKAGSLSAGEFETAIKRIANISNNTAEAMLKMQKLAEKGFVVRMEFEGLGGGEGIGGGEVIAPVLPPEPLQNRLEAWKLENLEMIENWAETSAALGEISNQWTDFEVQKNTEATNRKIRNAQRLANAEIKMLDNRLKSGVISEETHATLVADIRENLVNLTINAKERGAQEEAKIRRAQKPFLIAEAIANTAVAVTKVLANPILAILVAVAGAIQVARIASQRFQVGGRPPVGRDVIVGEAGPEIFRADTPGTIIPNDQIGRALDGGVQVAPIAAQRFQFGGRPTMGQDIIVGEAGPEIFRADTAGTIIPNDQIGGSGQTVHIYLQSIDPQTGIDYIKNHPEIILDPLKAFSANREFEITVEDGFGVIT